LGLLLVDGEAYGLEDDVLGVLHLGEEHLRDERKIARRRGASPWASLVDSPGDSQFLAHAVEARLCSAVAFTSGDEDGEHVRA
jgi:hypothetical protein